MKSKIRAYLILSVIEIKMCNTNFINTLKQFLLTLNKENRMVSNNAKIRKNNRYCRSSRKNLANC